MKDVQLERRVYTGRATDFYLASPDVPEIVNLAIDLRKPILVEGEPGCGKTRLAYSIAAELGLDAPVKISVRSTSRAQELLYRVNNLRRLQDAQHRDSQDARHMFPYLSLGLLGTALNQQRRVVVLIDEVDKADIDFPNDLLDVLEHLAFEIDELPPDEEEACQRKNGFGRVVQGDAGAPPIVVITSNREKRLPEPFLRRCLYLRLSFPKDPKELARIVEQNTKKDVPKWNAEILETAVEAFRRVREVSEGAKLQKLPSTSELIDWAKILYWKGETPKTINQDPYLPPYWRTLFKNMADLDKYPRLAAGQKEAGSD